VLLCRGMTMELLAPAGSYESLHSAIKAGADAVYFGITHLNMRIGSSAKKFDLDDLREIASICQNSGIRSYLTVNTILYDQDMGMMHTVLDGAKEAGITAVIVCDMAALLYAHSIKLEAHCSTQLSISNLEAVRFFAQYSDRLVLARELTLEQIKNICTQIREQDIRGPQGHLVEIEIFGHGAMCVSVSGRCFLSGFHHNLSANRGLCRQTCRRAYKVVDEETGHELEVHDKYILSPQDLCTLEFLDQVVDTGAEVLKIEGRGRSPEYVYTVISAYRKALDAIEDGTFTEALQKECLEDLKTVYNRGLSKGFFFGQPVDAWSGTYGSKATTRKIFIGKVTHYFPKPNVAEVLIQGSDTLKKGDQIYIIGSTTGTVKVSLDEIRDEEKNILETTSKGQTITFPVSERVRENDQVYVIESTQTVDQDKLQNY
jgi:putative protease